MSLKKVYAKVSTTDDIESQLNEPDIELQPAIDDSSTETQVDNIETRNDNQQHIAYHIHLDTPLINYSPIDYRWIMLPLGFFGILVFSSSMADLARAYIIAHKEKSS